MPSNFESLHDFSDAESNELNGLVNNLKYTFKEGFTRINDEYSRSKNTLDAIRRKVRDAEKDAEDEYISNFRSEKERYDKRIITIDNDIYDYKEKIGAFKNNIKTFKQRQDELRKKIDDSRSFSAKDEKAQQIIKKLKNFIKTFKEEKKKSLEQNILNELNILMHKRDLSKKWQLTLIFPVMM